MNKTARMISFGVGAVALAASAMLAGVHFRLLERSTAGRAAATWATAASAGDLARLRELGPPHKVTREVQVLGKAWHAKVGDAYVEVMRLGALQAQRVDETVRAARQEAYRAWWEQPYEKRQGGYDAAERWAWERTIEALPVEDRPLVVKSEDGDYRTLWAELDWAASRAWRDLSVRQRRNREAIDFVTREGPARLTRERQALLVEAGKPRLDADTLKVVNDNPWSEWAEEETFVQKHGERLLAEAYKGAYGDGSLREYDSQPAAPEGLLYHPGAELLTASLANGRLAARVTRGNDGDWYLREVVDLDVDALARAITGDVAEPEPEDHGGDVALGEVAGELARAAGSAAIDALMADAPPAEGSAEGTVETGSTGGLLTVLAGAFVVAFGSVMLSAVRRRKLDEVKVDIRDGERELDRVGDEGAFSRRRMVLTTSRVVLQEVHWWLARTREVVLPIERVDGAALNHRMNPWILLTGLLLCGWIAPAGVLVSLYALVAMQLVVEFSTAGGRARLTLSGTGAPGRDTWRFLRGVQRQYALVTGDDSASSDLMKPAPPLPDQVVPREAWGAVLAMMFAAAMQRLVQGGLSLETAPVLALFCALPAWVGHRTGARGGFVAGFFGVFGALSILVPSPRTGLFTVGMLAPAFAYLSAALAAGAVGWAAGRTRDSALGALATMLACALWLGVPWVAGTSAAWTTGVVAATLCAAGLSVLVGAMPRRSPTPPEAEAAAK